MSFRAKVCERVDTLTNKVETIGLPLIVEVLKLDGELEEKSVSEGKLLRGYPSLVDEPDSSNELAEVEVIWLWQYSIKEPGPQDVQIDQIFPSLVAARDLFLRVARHAVERTREAAPGVCNGLPMLHPNVSSQYCPRPVAVFVVLSKITLLAPQVEEKAREIDNRLVHKVARKAAWQRENTRETVEDARLR
jgi:hypothetical protein